MSLLPEPHSPAIEEAMLRKLNAETDLLLSKKAGEDIQTDARRIEYADTAASAEENNIFAFYFPVATQSVGMCMQTLAHWARKQEASGEKHPFTIELCSPGGNVIAGFALIDAIRELQRQGYEINTVGLGIVASMAAVILQTGDTRSLGKNSWLMIHEIEGEFEGSLAELGDTKKLFQRFNERTYELLAERSNVRLATLRTKARKQEWWLDADEALKAGFVDEIH
jgi:ATP-dependent protease ClpP protease subunit